MRQMNPDAYITRAQAAKVTGVSADAIGKWHARGWQDPCGGKHQLQTRPGPGRTLLYRLGDIMTAERETRRSPNSRRPMPALMAA